MEENPANTHFSENFSPLFERTTQCTRYNLLSTIVTVQCTCKLYSTVLHLILLYFTVLYFPILYFTVLYFTVLYFRVLYFTVLYLTVMNSTVVCYTVSVLGQEEGYTVKYSQSPRGNHNHKEITRKSKEHSLRDFQRAHALFHCKSQFESQNKQSVLTLYWSYIFFYTLYGRIYYH